MPTAATLPSLRLLVVDDEPVLLEALGHMLEADGHTVVTANGGKAGVAVFTAALGGAEPFAAVFTDLEMRHFDGRAVAKAIKAASPTTPVILLTGSGTHALDEDDGRGHVDWTLGKPCRIIDLHDVLARFFLKGDDGRR